MTLTTQQLVEKVNVKLQIVLARRATVDEILPKLITFTNFTTAQLNELNHELGISKLSVVPSLERLDADELRSGLRHFESHIDEWGVLTYYDEAIKEIDVDNPIASFARLRRAAQKELAVFLDPYRTRLIDAIDAIAANQYTSGQREELDFIKSMLHLVNSSPAHAYQLSKAEDAERYLDDAIDVLDEQLLPLAFDLSHDLENDTFLVQLLDLQVHEILEKQWEGVASRSLGNEWSMEQQAILDRANEIMDRAYLEEYENELPPSETKWRMKDYKVAIMLPRYYALMQEIEGVGTCWKAIQDCQREHAWRAWVMRAD